jgi:uncharacterized protein YigA (DUF484 family)
MPKGATSQRKERVTVSLSPSSVEFLRRFSAEENLHVSTVLENMIENSRREKELAQLNASISSFYDSLSDAALQEQAAWGEAGEAGLVAFESEIEKIVPEAAPVGR